MICMTHADHCCFAWMHTFLNPCPIASFMLGLSMTTLATRYGAYRRISTEGAESKRPLQARRWMSAGALHAIAGQHEVLVDLPPPGVDHF